MQEAELQFPRIPTEEEKHTGLSGKWCMRLESKREWRRQRNIMAWAIIRVHIAEPELVKKCVSQMK
jgi:hypothetical protein